jgi:hypothetical protein
MQESIFVFFGEKQERNSPLVLITRGSTDMLRKKAERQRQKELSSVPLWSILFEGKHL